MRASPFALKTTILVAVVLAAVAGTVFFLSPRGVMPLDSATLEQYQEANSRFQRRLMEKEPGMSYSLRTAKAMRQAIRSRGYHPDTTLAYWMSPQFKADVQAGPPGDMVGAIRLVDSLLAAALGDGSGEEEISRVLDLWSSDIAEAARARRGG